MSMKTALVHGLWRLGIGAGTLHVDKWAVDGVTKNPNGWLTPPRVALLLVFLPDLFPAMKRGKMGTAVELAQAQAGLLYLQYVNLTAGEGGKTDLLSKFMARLKLDFKF